MTTLATKTAADQSAGATPATTPHRAAIMTALERRAAGAVRQAFTAWLDDLSGRAFYAPLASHGLALSVLPGRSISPETIAKARAGLARIMQPAPRDLIVEEARKALTATARRDPTAGDAAALIALLVDFLAEFPADVISTAFRSWIATKTFWPTVAEIREHCDREYRWRVSLAASLDRAERDAAERARALAGTGKDWCDMTEADRAELDAKLAAARAAILAGGGMKPLGAVLPDVSRPMPRPASAAGPDPIDGGNHAAS